MKKIPEIYLKLLELKIVYTFALVCSFYFVLIYTFFEKQFLVLSVVSICRQPFCKWELLLTTNSCEGLQFDTHTCEIKVCSVMLSNRHSSMWRHWSCLCYCENMPAGDTRDPRGRPGAHGHHVGGPWSTLFWNGVPL